MCRAVPSSAKESEPAGFFAPEKGAENRCAALLPLPPRAAEPPRARILLLRTGIIYGGIASGLANTFDFAHPYVYIQLLIQIPV